ncbi:hypothetical protein Emag_006963 [Eimeria magna]
MLTRYISLASCAAVFQAVSAGAFHLQSSPTKAAFVVGSSPSQSTRGLEASIAGSSTVHPLRVHLKDQWTTASDKLRMPAAFAHGESGDLTEDDGSALAMASFLRCHKPLLNDRGNELPDGNLCMLLRGCDAHQRMISPLELKTNAAALPGAAGALMMVKRGPAAEEALCKQFKEKEDGTGEACSHVHRVALLRLEVGKLHRLLQYATAAGLKKGFLNQDAMQVMLELYEETGLNSENILKVVEALKDFYKEVHVVEFSTVVMCLQRTSKHGRGRSRRAAFRVACSPTTACCLAARILVGGAPAGVSRREDTVRLPARASFKQKNRRAAVDTLNCMLRAQPPDPSI